MPKPGEYSRLLASNIGNMSYSNPTYTPDNVTERPFPIATGTSETPSITTETVVHSTLMVSEATSNSDNSNQPRDTSFSSPSNVNSDKEKLHSTPQPNHSPETPLTPPIEYAENDDHYLANRSPAILNSSTAVAASSTNHSPENPLTPPIEYAENDDHYLANRSPAILNNSTAVDASSTNPEDHYTINLASSGSYKKVVDVNGMKRNMSIAKGFMDISLLTANANQMKQVLLYGDTSSTVFYIILVGLILSLTLQITTGVLLIMKEQFDINVEKDRPSAERYNNATTALIFVTLLLNVFVSSFGTSFVKHPTDDAAKYPIVKETF